MFRMKYVWLFVSNITIDRDDSNKTADGCYQPPQEPFNSPLQPIPRAPHSCSSHSYGRQGSSHNHRRHDHRNQRRHHKLLRQKTDSTDIPGSSQEGIHVPKCRMLSGENRVRSLAASLRLYESRDFIEYESSSSSQSSHCSSSSASSSCSTGAVGVESSCSSTSFAQRRPQAPPTTYRYENLERIKTFRSMPDVNREVGGVATSASFRQLLAVNCGHKDCRDYYRLQALRAELDGNVGARGTHKPPTNTSSMEKPTLYREREIDLAPSSAEEDEVRRQGQGQETGVADAFSVHGLSDAISVESSKSDEESRTTTSEFMLESLEISCESFAANNLISPLLFVQPRMNTSAATALLCQPRIQSNAC